MTVCNIHTGQIKLGTPIQQVSCSECGDALPNYFIISMLGKEHVVLHRGCARRIAVKLLIDDHNFQQGIDEANKESARAYAEFSRGS